MTPAPAGMPPGATPATPGAGAHVHVRVGRCHIAIPVDQVREALPMPPEGLTPLPRRHNALSGLLHVAGSVVPVVALERWLPIDATAETGASRLLVLQHAGGRVGLRVDAVLGVKPALSGAGSQVHHAEDEDELFDAVIPAAHGVPALCRLEVGRLMRLSQVWCDETQLDRCPPHPPADAGAARAEPVATQRHAVFRIADELWAVPLCVVDRVAPLPAVELALGGGRRSWAIAEWHGRKLPLVDISTARAASSRASAPWMVLVSDGPLALGLTVAACLQFVDLAMDACAATPEDELLAGIALVPDIGKLRVLDPAKLFRLTPETSISREPAAGSTEIADAPGDQAEPEPYLVFEADQRYASPVDGIVGVVELPEAARADLRAGKPAVLAWRGRTLRVVNLPTLSDARRTEGRIDARLAVLVRAADRTLPPLGIAIHRLTDWLPAHSAWRSGMRMGGLGAFSLIDAPASPDIASVVVVDLAQMAYLLD